MSLNNLKKSLIFSSLEVKELVDKMVADKSYTIDQKTSTILESFILDGLLTENSQVRFWIRNLYSGASSGEILGSIFSYNAAGINWESNHLPLLPFLEFAISEQKYMKFDSWKDDRIYHLVDHLDSLKNIFIIKKDQCLDFEFSLKYSETVKTLEYIIETFRGDEYVGQFIYTYRFFRKNWEDCKDSTHTFRVLADMAYMQKGWRDTEESRYGLASLLQNLAACWPLEME